MDADQSGSYESEIIPVLPNHEHYEMKASAMESPSLPCKTRCPR